MPVVVVADEIEFTSEQFARASTYLPRLIGEMALQHHCMSEIVPAGLDEAEWRDILMQIAEGLIAYGTKIDDATFDEGQELTDNAKRSLELFAHWFDQMWGDV